MFCSKCGAELIEGAAFCQKCGAKVDNEKIVSTEVVYEGIAIEDMVSEEAISPQNNVPRAGAERIHEVFDVTLVKAGPNRGYVIRELRDWLGIQLKEASKLVKSLPVLLKKSVTREEAESLKAGFMKVGATLIFADQSGGLADIALHCRSCGAILNNGQTVCRNCGNALKVTPPYKKDSVENCLMELNCIDRSDFRKKLFTEIKDAYINRIYDLLIGSVKGSLAVLYFMIFGGLFIALAVVGYLLSFPILLIIVTAAGYIWYQLRGAKWVTHIYYTALSKVLLLPEDMTPQTLVDALNGKFNYPYFKGARCSIEGECLIEGRYSVYSVKFSKDNIPQLDCDPEENDKRYRTILREAIAVRSYLNKFFAPAYWEDTKKEFKALKLAEGQRKMAAVVSGVATLIVVIAIFLNVIGSNISGGISRLFQPGVEVRSAYLTQYSDKVTIEEAFDNFFDNGKWSKYEEAGYTYVVFTGVCEYAGERADVKITFKITGENFIVDSLDLNGRSQNDFMLYMLLTAVYEDY